MLLTISTTRAPATDLGYLLHKHPDKWQSFELPFGKVQVYYPQADEALCTAALLLELDPIRLTRRARSDAGFALRPYVNDRPYVLSSFMSVALARVLGSALGGRCKERPELVETALPLKLGLTALPCRGGEALLKRLFEPLGYRVSASAYPLDDILGWGESEYVELTLRGTLPLYQALRQLYVLLPVLDDDKHYWVGDDEVRKLLEKGEGWLTEHPERAFIARRYLKRQRELEAAALSGLGTPPVVERRRGLHEERLTRVADILSESGAASVLDLGCGEGKLLAQLVNNPQFTRLVGADVSPRALQRAQKALSRSGTSETGRVTLLQSSLLYRDERLSGFDAAALVEVIEHLDPARLDTLERNVFEFAHPNMVVLSTPNAEYNALYPDAVSLRHPDHRFEWTRAEFRAWAEGVARRCGYAVRFGGVGPEDETFGPPTQLAVFEVKP